MASSKGPDSSLLCAAVSAFLALSIFTSVLFLPVRGMGLNRTLPSNEQSYMADPYQGYVMVKII